MKRGVIMELKDGVAVLMDGTGDIASVPAHSGWRVGDTAAFPRKQTRAARWAAMAAALVLVAAGGVFGGFYMSPYSLVSLDVNPSVELTLNRFDRVISARAMNDEGAELLGLSGVENKTASEALEVLLSGDYLADYLGSDAYVTMTVRGGSADTEKALLSVMDAAAERELCANYQGIRVDCVSVDTDTVEEAHGHGVTAGKYLALMELQEANPDVDLSAYAHCGIGEIKAETERCHRAAGEPEVEPPAGEGCEAGGRGNGYGYHYHGGRHE